MTGKVLSISSGTFFSIGSLGAIVSIMFGEWSQMLTFFFCAIVLDYVTGLLASVKDGTGLNSNVGLWGLLKKVLMVLSIMLSYRADLAFGTNFLMTGMIYAWLVNELISIAENYGRLGLPLSDKLKPLLSILKSKQDEKK